MSRANDAGIFDTLGRIGDPPFPWPRDLYSLEIEDRSEFERLKEMKSRFVMTLPERTFVVAMSFFVNQAKRERREEAFLGQFYGRVFAKWPERLRGQHFHYYQAERKTYLRLRLLKCHEGAHLIEPPCDWEVFLALPDLEHHLVSDYLIEKGREHMRELGNRIMARSTTASAPIVNDGPESINPTSSNDESMEGTDDESTEGTDDESMEGSDDSTTEDGSGSENSRSDDE